MRTISVRSPRVLGSQASHASIPRAIAATRRSTPRAIAGASTACASCEGAALSGLPRLLRRPDDLPDRDLDALGGPGLADPVAHELAAAAGTHQHAALGPDPAARPPQRRHRRPRGQAPPARGYPGGAGMHSA